MGLEEFGAATQTTTVTQPTQQAHQIATGLPPKELYGVSKEEVPNEECKYRVVKEYPGTDLVAVYCKLRHEYLVKNFVKLCKPSICPIKSMWEEIKAERK